MANQVFRYNNKEEYLDPHTKGTPVSAKFNTWEAAEEERNFLREGDPHLYYNIVYVVKISLITLDMKGGKNE